MTNFSVLFLILIYTLRRRDHDGYGDLYGGQVSRCGGHGGHVRGC